jgi:hypothetical protein
VTDTYPELRNNVAAILRGLGDRRGAELLEYVESTESSPASLYDEIDMLKQELEEAKGDLQEARIDAADLRGLIGVWAAKLDDLDVDSEARSDLIPIIEKMRKSAK